MTIEDWTLVFDDYYVNKLQEKEMSEKHDLPVKRLLSKSFPVYSNSNLRCEHCDSLLEAKFKGRSFSIDKDEMIFNLTEIPPMPSNFKKDRYTYYRPSQESLKTIEGYKVSIPTCPGCGHRPTRGCKCESCEKIKIRNIDIIYQKYLDEYPTSNMPVIASFSVQQLFRSIQILKVSTELINFYKIEGKDKKLLLDTGLFMPDKKSIIDFIYMESIFHYWIGDPDLYVQNSNFSRKELITSLNERITYIATMGESFVSIIAMWLQMARSELHYLLCRTVGVDYYIGDFDKIFDLIDYSLKTYGLSWTCTITRYSVEVSLSFSGGSDSIYKMTKRIEKSLKHCLSSESAMEQSNQSHTLKRDFLDRNETNMEFARIFLKPNSVEFFDSPINLDSFY